MGPKFDPGDVVKCKGGGPNMVVGAVLDNAGMIFIGQPAPIPNVRHYTCYYWNDHINQFTTFNLPEAALMAVNVDDNEIPF